VEGGIGMGWRKGFKSLDRRERRRNMKVEKADKSEGRGRDGERRMQQRQQVNVDSVLRTSPIC